MRVGVDVGGTNTDAVLMEGDAVLASFKAPTTADVEGGIVGAIRAVMADADVAAESIESVMIGTTQFTNAFVEGRRLVEVAVIRAALPATASVQPLLDFPDRLANAVGNHPYLVPGGYEFDGREISPLGEKEVLAAARDIKRKGLNSVAISCVFSPINDAMEKRIAEILRNEINDVELTLSTDIGRVGLIERENATIMNASLVELSKMVVGSFRTALKNLNITAPFFVSQNDGTLMSADYVERYPVLTFASGPTNSMRGAARLSGQDNAVVVDIGGTTTDVGVLVHGFPRESAVSVDIGGVRTNFRMPDILSIGLGGGSYVRDGERLTVGPDSVGFELTEKALVFGGDILTTTDIAVAAGAVDIGDKSRVKNINAALVKNSLAEIHRLIENAIDRVKTSVEDSPVVLVGGGSVLVTQKLRGASEVNIPDKSAVANAIGAGMAQVGGEIDRIFSYEIEGRDAAMARAKEEAIQRAVAAGAVADSVQILEVEELPLTYMPAGAVRLRIKAVGDLAMRKGGDD